MVILYNKFKQMSIKYFTEKVDYFTVLRGDVLKSLCYYAFDDPSTKNSLDLCSNESNKYPLTVNCAGKLSATIPFTTDNPSGREDYYLIYMLRGAMEIDMQKSTEVVEAGNIILFPPKYHYKYFYRADSELSYYWVHFTGSYASMLLSEIGLSTLPLITKLRSDNSIHIEFNRIFEIFEKRGALRDRELGCALEHLLLTVSSSIEGEMPIGRTLERSLGYIHSAYNTNLRIPDLARIENLSNSRYIVIFNELMGMSPSEYIISLRVRIACDYLCNTDMSIKQIGALVGYDDPQLFSRTFKRQMGQSPREYRNGAVTYE